MADVYGTNLDSLMANRLSQEEQDRLKAEGYRNFLAALQRGRTSQYRAESERKRGDQGYDIDNRSLSERGRQFDVRTAENARQFDVETGEGSRQFDADLAYRSGVSKALNDYRNRTVDVNEKQFDKELAYRTGRDTMEFGAKDKDRESFDKRFDKNYKLQLADTMGTDEAGNKTLSAKTVDAQLEAAKLSANRIPESIAAMNFEAAMGEQARTRGAQQVADEANMMLESEVYNNRTGYISDSDIRDEAQRLAGGNKALEDKLVRDYSRIAVIKALRARGIDPSVVAVDDKGNFVPMKSDIPYIRSLNPNLAPMPGGFDTNRFKTIGVR